MDIIFGSLGFFIFIVLLGLALSSFFTVQTAETAIVNINSQHAQRRIRIHLFRKPAGC